MHLTRGCNNANVLPPSFGVAASRNIALFLRASRVATRFEIIVYKIAQYSWNWCSDYNSKYRFFHWRVVTTWIFTQISIFCTWILLYVSITISDIKAVTILFILLVHFCPPSRVEGIKFVSNRTGRKVELTRHQQSITEALTEEIHLARHAHYTL